MKTYLKLFPLLLFLFLVACNSSDDSYSGIAWDEEVDGELSGELLSPSFVSLQVGDNRIIGSSTPAEGAMCTTFEGGPPVPIIPYFPNHESYVDVFSFNLSENERLVSITVESLDVSPFHNFEDFPCIGSFEEQNGAFVAINNSDKIDWNSDNVINFISLPVTYPLIGIGFAKSVNENILNSFRQDFPLPGYEGVNNENLDISNGTYTFWWKEGANNADYTLNFVVEKIN